MLFTKEAPRAAENFRALCTCEKGSVPNEPGREGAGKPYCYQGAYYRIIDQVPPMFVLHIIFVCIWLCSLQPCCAKCYMQSVLLTRTEH